MLVLQELPLIQTNEPFASRADDPKHEEENPQPFVSTTDPVCPVDALR